MITRPTTDELIGDCCRELTDAILPALTDETLRLRLVMTETVLRNAAVRAAHEIAWMLDETSGTAGIRRARWRPGTRASAARRDGCRRGGPADSLHLADVVERYERAGQAFADGAGGSAGSRGRGSRRAGPRAAARPDRDREGGDGHLCGRRPLNIVYVLAFQKVIEQAGETAA